MIYIHFVSNENKVVFSNLKPDFLFYIDFNENFEERIKCPANGMIKRHSLFQQSYGKIYIAIYDENLTQRNFGKYKKIIISLIPALGKLGEQNEKNQTKKIRRLKHNLVNYNANILQHIYKLIPQESLISRERNQLEIIEKILISKTKDASYTMLRILKSANLMKAEFDVYDMLNTKNPYLDFQNHNIHKVVILTLNSFWLDLIEKNITIEVSKCDTLVQVDYKSISVALCHIFDNATKYTLPKSNFSILFREDEDHVYLNIKMLSLKLEENEKNQIFSESFSGKWATALGLSGDGIGMTVVKRIIELNDGLLNFETNTNPANSIEVNKIPYVENILEIRLNKVV